MKKLVLLLIIITGVSVTAKAQKVFSVDYESQAGDNDGKWFFTAYGSQADLKIYFVEYESQAGWVSNAKKSLLY